LRGSFQLLAASYQLLADSSKKRAFATSKLTVFVWKKVKLEASG